jgi:hypothetical protein
MNENIENSSVHSDSVVNTVNVNDLNDTIDKVIYIICSSGRFVFPGFMRRGWVDNIIFTFQKSVLWWQVLFAIDMKTLKIFQFIVIML